MAVKPVIDIDINDAKFKAFLSSFDKYKKALKSMPADWQKTTGATDANLESVSKITDELDKQIGKLSEIERQKAKAHEREKARLDDLRQRMKKHLDAIREQTHRMISGLSAIFSVPGMVFGGLAATAGLWGMDRLARGVTDVRRQAGGLGVSVGALKAAKSSYGRFLDPESTLGNIADAQSNPASRGAFARLGLGYQDKTADQILPEIVQKAWTLWQSTKDHTDVRLQASGLGQFMSMADWRNIGGMDRATITQARSTLLSRKGDQDLNPADVKKWSDLDASLQNAKDTIDKVLVAGLAPLTPDLKKLSDAFGAALQKILKVAKDDGWMDKLAKGMESIADTVTRPEFIDGLKTFAKNIPLVVEGLVNALLFLNLIPTALNPAEQANADRLKDVHAKDAPYQAQQKKDIDAIVSTAANLWGVSAQFLKGVFANETSSGRNLKDSPAGAKGYFQFVPKTAAQYNVNPFDLSSSANGAAHMIADLMKHYHGDWQKAAAAYNWGQGHVDWDVKHHKSSWLSYAPKETRDYVQKITVQVNNNTGGNANVMALATSAGTVR